MTDPEHATTTRPFEPARFMSRVNGADYLEVKWRLVWLRDRHPDASIITQLVEHHLTEKIAVFRCDVSIPRGGSASSYGHESGSDFRDYLEKAETKAIGRALAALGFGTQFAPDFEFGANVGRVVDSPVKVSRMARREIPRVDPTEAALGPEQPATPRQLNYLQAVAREAGLSKESLEERCVTEFGVPTARLMRRDCSTLIDQLQSRIVRTP